MKFNLKMLAVATAVMTSSAFAAGLPGGTTATAGAELHWDGKVPVEVTSDSVILTGLNGTPLTTELKGGSLYIEKDGSFTSSGIPLELHHRMCDDGASDGTCDTSSGASFVTGEEADAVGDIIDTATWTLMASRYTVGGRETPDLDAATIDMDGTPLVIGTASTAAVRPVFTTKYTPDVGAVAPAPGTQYAAYASIIASTAL